MSAGMELGPVLEEPCGYFYRLGVRRGLALASGARLEKVRGEISARMWGAVAAGPVGPRWQMEQQWLTDECEALALRVDVAEERLEQRGWMVGGQLLMLEWALEGPEDRRLGAAQYLERMRISRALGREAVGGTTDNTESTDGEGLGE